MTSTNSHPSAAKPEEGAKTEADVKSSDGDSGKGEKSSHDEKSREKAGTNEGAGRQADKGVTPEALAANNRFEQKAHGALPRLGKL